MEIFCGYKMSEVDVYSSNLKCGNPLCSERLDRMRGVLGSCMKPEDLDLNKFLVIDRFKWETTGIDKLTLLGYVKNSQEQEYHDYLLGFMKTDLQKRNLELVWKASWIVLKERL